MALAIIPTYVCQFFFPEDISALGFFFPSNFDSGNTF